MAERKRTESQKRGEKKYDEKRAGQRTRNWTLIFYPEDLPEDWKEQTDSLRVKWIESPLHDKDTNSDGTPKKAHVHTLFMFENVKTKEQVVQMFGDLFGTSENGSIIGIATPQQVSDRSGIVRYMSHMDNPEKFQYDASEIVGHNGADVMEILRYSMSETLDKMKAIEEYIEKHGITELADLSKAIRDTHPEWYQIITTKNTVYFTALLRSHRHKAQGQGVIYVNDNGEVIDSPVELLRASETQEGGSDEQASTD